MSNRNGSFNTKIKTYELSIGRFTMLQSQIGKRYAITDFCNLFFVAAVADIDDIVFVLLLLMLLLMLLILLMLR